VSAFINSFSDNTADAAYAGDLQGNLWRLDLTKTTAANYYEPPSLIAQLTSESGMAQPITTPPALALDSYTGKRFVFVGTGRLLDDSDITSSQEQSFYAILDGTRTMFLKAPANPLTRKDFANNTDVKGVTLTSDQSGWFINLGTGTNGNAYRINTPITVSASVVAFAKNLPDNSDVCNPSGSAEGFGINYSTGKTVLPSAAAHVHIDGLVSLINFYNTAPYDKGVVISYNADGTTKGSTTDPCPNNQCRTISTANAFKVLNWREVPNTD
jgi:type IV pilus assembly protein PilY1